MAYQHTIYTVCTFDRFVKAGGFTMPKGATVHGFFMEKEKALNAVRDNAGDIRESSYDYAFVEKIGEGLYNVTKERWFFKWDQKARQYVEIKEPEGMKNMIGFSMK